jgi:hypothetical protein
MVHDESGPVAGSLLQLISGVFIKIFLESNVTRNRPTSVPELHLLEESARAVDAAGIGRGARTGEICCGVGAGLRCSSESEREKCRKGRDGAHGIGKHGISLKRSQEVVLTELYSLTKYGLYRVFIWRGFE